jgi:hypothetical protein
MIKIRTGVFETNSSSMHSMSIISRKEFDNFKNSNNYYIAIGENKVYSKPDLCEYIAKQTFSRGLTYRDLINMDKEEFDKIAEDHGYTDYHSFLRMPFEVFEYKYCSESGDDIVMLGYYSSM